MIILHISRLSYENFKSFEKNLLAMSFAIHTFIISNNIFMQTRIIQFSSPFARVRYFVRCVTLRVHTATVCVHACVHVYSIITESEKVCFR